MSSKVQKSIRFPAIAVEVIDSEVKRTLGIDFNDYLQAYVIAEAQRIQRSHKYSTELLDEINLAKRQAQAGKRRTMETAADVDTYVKLAA